MPLVSINELTVRFRGPALFENISNNIEHGERIGLLGRNGTGKTTLMKVLVGQIVPDHGTITNNSGAKVALLPQGVPQDIPGTVEEIVREGLTHHDIEHQWQNDVQVKQILSRMNLRPDAKVSNMSSGMKRRVLLARSLVNQPDLLLLDEPTNHLDIDAIIWLEEFLLRWPTTLMFVTHDRQFLKRLATRIWEIDAGQLFDWSCDYTTFLERKQAALEAQEKQAALFQKRLAEEEVWIRQGIKARRTRNEGRVRRLEEMRRIHQERRTKVGVANLRIQEAARSGALVSEVKNVTFAHSTDPNAPKILDNFSTTIMRGDKIGIIGQNGSGKSTLLKVLLGEKEPQSGTVRLGTNLQVIYFDQLREQLNEEQTIEQCVSDGYEMIKLDGRPRHVLGYLQDFLFTPDRARTQIKFLSGGERSRVLLAKLFAKPANIIVLDEPTNDLDAETLDMLEERLVDFSGTLLVVSHDREFLNNVVTSTIVIEVAENGKRSTQEYTGGYDDWLRQRETSLRKSEATSGSTLSKSTATNSRTGNLSTTEPHTPTAATAVKKKLSYKEQRELDELPAKIEGLEAMIATLHSELADPAFYKQSGEKIAEVQTKLQRLEEELRNAYERWEDLESKSEKPA